jgi:hypothetical protein
MAGLDWGLGGKDPTACVGGVLDENDVLWIFFEYYKRDKDLADTAFALKTWHDALYDKTNQIALWSCDHNPQAIHYLRNYRLSGADLSPSLDARKAPKGRGSIEWGIDLINSRINSGRLKILRGACPALTQEGRAYSYDAKSKKPMGADHATDALRYLCQMIWRKYKT